MSSVLALVVIAVGITMMLIGVHGASSLSILKAPNTAG